MSYQVTAPLVLAKDQEGHVHHRYRGDIIQWLSPEQRESLLEMGMVIDLDAGEAAATEPAKAKSRQRGRRSRQAEPIEDDDSTDPDEVEPESVDADQVDAEPQDGKPLNTAPKAAWVDYAVSKGADRDEVAALDKQELIELYG